MSKWSPRQNAKEPYEKSSTETRLSHDWLWGWRSRHLLTCYATLNIKRSGYWLENGWTLEAYELWLRCKAELIWRNGRWWWWWRWWWHRHGADQVQVQTRLTIERRDWVFVWSRWWRGHRGIRRWWRSWKWLNRLWSGLRAGQARLGWWRSLHGWRGQWLDDDGRASCWSRWWELPWWNGLQG